MLHLALMRESAVFLRRSTQRREVLGQKLWDDSNRGAGELQAPNFAAERQGPWSNLMTPIVALQIAAKPDLHTREPRRYPKNWPDTK